MKKLILLIITALSSSTTSFAWHETDLFTYDEQKVYMELAEVSQLEEAITANPNLSLNDLYNHQTIATSIDLSDLDTNSPLTPKFGMDDMDWESFAWGFCCWQAGLFTVVINDNKDRNSRVSYVIGIGSCVAITIVSYVATYLVIGVAMLSQI